MTKLEGNGAQTATLGIWFCRLGDIGDISGDIVDVGEILTFWRTPSPNRAFLWFFLLKCPGPPLTSDGHGILQGSNNKWNIILKGKK